jgi:hypothetical protein
MSDKPLEKLLHDPNLHKIGHRVAHRLFEQGVKYLQSPQFHSQVQQTGQALVRMIR